MNNLEKETEAAIQLIAYLHKVGETDPQLTADMIEAETQFNEVLTYFVHKCLELEALENGIKAYEVKLAMRKKRFQMLQDEFRERIGEAMDKISKKTYPLAIATLTRKNVAGKVVILDENLLPDDCIVTKREASRSAIKERLDRGEQVPGATLSNGGTTISIRVI